MKNNILIILSVLLYSSVSQAETESWYFNASIGLANKHNPYSVEQVISSAENTYGVSRVSISVDYGFYWPVFSESLILGVVSNASVDSVQDNNFNEVVAHDLKYRGISVIKFIENTVGEGLFVRGDVGQASAKYRYSGNAFEAGDGSGSATLIGVGYGKPLTGNRTRIIFSFNTIRSSIDSREFNSNQFMAGVMW